MAAAERQAPRALMHVGQVAWEASLPYQGNISSLQQPPTLQALHHLLQVRGGSQKQGVSSSTYH